MCRFSKRHQQDTDTSLATVYPPLLMTPNVYIHGPGEEGEAPHGTGSSWDPGDRGTENRVERPAQSLAWKQMTFRVRTGSLAPA